VKGVINVDGAGRFRDLVALAHASETAASVAEAVSTATNQPIAVDAEPHPFSDQWPFVRRGVPAIQLHSDSGDRGRGWGHTHADTRDKVDDRNVREHAMLIALLVVAEFAAPERDAPRLDRDDLIAAFRDADFETGACARPTSGRPAGSSAGADRVVHDWSVPAIRSRIAPVAAAACRASRYRSPKATRALGRLGVDLERDDALVRHVPEHQRFGRCGTDPKLAGDRFGSEQAVDQGRVCRAATDRARTAATSRRTSARGNPPADTSTTRMSPSRVAVVVRSRTVPVSSLVRLWKSCSPESVRARRGRGRRRRRGRDRSLRREQARTGGSGRSV